MYHSFNFNVYKSNLLKYIIARKANKKVPKIIKGSLNIDTPENL